MAKAVEERTGLTTEGPAQGTLRYMSPELFEEDIASPTLESDIWALACVVGEVGKPLQVSNPFVDLASAIDYHRTNTISPSKVFSGHTDANYERQRPDPSCPVFSTGRTGGLDSELLGR